MQYTIKELSQHLWESVDNIYEVFKNFFGESYVDLQKPKEKGFLQRVFSYVINSGVSYTGPTKDSYTTPFEISDVLLKNLEEFFASTKAIIYVWWPRVTITNEYDRSVVIQDLYAKVEIQIDGRIPYENRGFLLNRATYNLEQFISGYMHSHIQNVPKDDFQVFMPPCLGNGPIVETIGTLKNEGDEVTWMLFCQELAMYVTVESISGGPWKRMENIGIMKPMFGYSGYGNINSITKWERLFTKATLRSFISYYLKNGHLAVNYRNGEYQCGLPYHEYIIDVSNAFIDYFNKELKTTRQLVIRCYEHTLLQQAIITNGKFYRSNNDLSFVVRAIDSYQNKLVLVFKGKEIRTHIDDSMQESDTTVSTVLDHNVAMFILKHILEIINFRYRNEYTNEYRDSASATDKRVYYL